VLDAEEDLTIVDRTADIILMSREAIAAGLEARIHLDDVQMPGALRQALGEDPRAAAHLEHDIVSRQRSQPLNHVNDVAIDEEVLTQLPLPGRARAHQPKTAAALRCTAASKST